MDKNKSAAILTEQDFRDAISKQCGFDVNNPEPISNQVNRSTQRFLMDRLAEKHRREDRAESERQILRCAPPFDAQAEHGNDLRQESLRDFYEQETE